MRTISVISIILILSVCSLSQAAPVTYSIVDYPAAQIDIVTGLTDHVSGTITADPATGIISSASFTITAASSHTVLSAVISSPYYVHISPTEITINQDNPGNPNGYGFLMLSNGNSGNTYPIEQLSWYVPGNPWVAGTFPYASYMGAYTTGSKIFDGDFAGSLGSCPWVIATAVPEPATLLLFALGGIALRRRIIK